MIYRKGRKKKPVEITREDINKAMRDFKGEIQHLKIKSDSSKKINPVTVAHPFITQFGE